MKFTKASPVFLALLILGLCSCNPQQEQNASDSKTRRDSLVPYQVTVLAELPDSLQPKTYLLEEIPTSPETVVPKKAGQGTGLGLSLSYDIIKAQGGELKVETKQGEGSIFTIQMPLS